MSEVISRLITIGLTLLSIYLWKKSIKWITIFFRKFLNQSQVKIVFNVDTSGDLSFSRGCDFDVAIIEFMDIEKQNFFIRLANRETLENEARASSICFELDLDKSLLKKKIVFKMIWALARYSVFKKYLGNKKVPIEMGENAVIQKLVFDNIRKFDTADRFTNYYPISLNDAPKYKFIHMKFWDKE